MMLIKNAPRREYRLKDETLVPGVTTVLDCLDKPALKKWLWEGGFAAAKREQPIEYKEWCRENKDATAGVGTIAHYKIQCFLNKEMEEYGPGWEEEHIKMAQVPFESFLRYYEQERINPILTEYSSVHERHRYGGTFDLLAETRRGVRLIDFKSSKNIYDEYYIQLAAYKALLTQHREWRGMKIRERVVLVAKDGRLEAPDMSEAYMSKAKATWTYLIKMYHRLNEFRKAA